jgi:hypothetical protein
VLFETNFYFFSENRLTNTLQFLLFLLEPADIFKKFGVDVMTLKAIPTSYVLIFYSL